jgi:lipid II:glycine glycyltransferase (peptidoglycan interpeptide bridge formation enzyme)
LIKVTNAAPANGADVGLRAPTDDPDHKRAGYTRFKRSFGGQVKEHAGIWDLPSMP